MYGNHLHQPYGGSSSRNVESPSQALAMIDGAAMQAQCELLAAGESISAWRVSQSTLVILKAVSFESLGFRMQNVPSLYRLTITEAKVNSFIHCFVGAQKIVSLHDLELEICESEGIKSFEELGLGPLLKHPLVVHYFSVGYDVTEFCKITAEQIVAYLSICPTKQRETTADDLLTFIAKKKKISRINLCIRIRSLGMHIGYIKRGRRSEGTILKKCNDGLDLKSILDDNEHYDVNTAKDAAYNKNYDAHNSSPLSSQTATTSDPSTSAQVAHSLTSYLDSNNHVGQFGDFCTKVVKTPKNWMTGNNFKPEKFDVETGFIDDNAVDRYTRMFIDIWKGPTQTRNVVEVFDKMLSFYHGKIKLKKKNEILNMFSSYPYVGLLNVAIASIKFGLWDRMSFAPQTNSKVVPEITNSANSATCALDVNRDAVGENEMSNKLMVSENKVISSLEVNQPSNDCKRDIQPILDFVGDDLPCLEASMSHQLLELLVAQASHSLSENEYLSIQNVEELLTKQFPLIPFKLDIKRDSLEDVVKANKSIPVSKTVVFSAALLSCNNHVNSETHISSKDAIEVLLKAPMLTDLNTWSHWDVLFAPSLGPLTLFLSKETNTKELLCLVTRLGNVIRIDHTATVDLFLEASINMSSFQTSLNLLSLFALYGGEENVPLSLLKCHAEKALKVIVNNKENGISSASKFVLECLTFLPREFRCFATDLLLSGFRSVVKDASSAILRECKHVEERLMLHELGLSLGIMEWIDDYKTFSISECNQENDLSVSYSPAEGKGILVQKDECKVVKTIVKTMDLISSNNEEDPAKIIESIRREEFGLDPNISVIQDSILKKQHARLGRALQCLSQELYSQDSHFLLELVQNADDNVYPCDVEPTLTFILKEEGVIVLNNEQGFSVENIKALCDVGNSTKKEANAGYIGKKGIGFKSVFRVTDAPEIHSNGFHIKFDISDGQIGFVLPTVVPPCDVNLFSKLVSMDNNPTDEKHWNTCIVLPFRSKKAEAENLVSMFTDLHPSLLLFLHRLKCIKFRNLLDDSFTVMRKQVVGDGIVNVTLGKDKMNWFVKSRKLQADHIRSDVQTTEISMALMLEDLDNGNYIQKLEHQPVFAFLPLRNYGLQFIIQADFILPSSREEVDGDSPWNQWLLSEFPNLFVTAELAFCNLPCFKENPAKGISVFMSFVPLGGEVHGFFSCLPRMIISKLRVSNCLLLEGDINEWVPPCKVVRNWTEQVRSLLPDNLIKEHLGVCYLNKDTVITDSLAQALGIEECGPKILVQVMTSLCRAGFLKSMGLKWLSSWLNVLYLMLANETQSDIITSLSQLPFVPLLDGKYASVDEGAIWLHTDSKHGLEACGKLYSNLQIVNPAIFNDSPVENITQMLYKIGVQRLSAHEVLKVHILTAISDTTKSKELMTEYLCFIMFHLDSPCPECRVEREHILSQLHNNAFISTNGGYKRLVDVPIHFSKEFGNPIDMNKLINGTDMNWFEIDIGYLKHPGFKSSSGGILKWRKFLQDLGVMDFVQVVKVEKRIEDMPHAIVKKMMLDDECISSGSTVIDYDSQELTNLLSHVSSTGDREKSKYLLEVVNTLWDDYFSDKVRGLCIVNGEKKPFKSSVMRILNSVRWLASGMDDQLHFPKDLFHNCETVHAVLGETAPYVIPKITSVKLLNDIGLKNKITLDDALSVLQVWTRSEKPFKASVSQMSKLYTYIWNEMSISKQKIVDNLHSKPFIFVPDSFGIGSTHEAVSGSFLSPNEVYWHDLVEETKSTHLTKMLCNIYPSLHYFFVNEFGVAENPPLLSYLQSLLQLSTGNLPSQAAKTVFKVFLKWSDGLESGVLSCEDIEFLKKSMEEKEMKILPTVHDKWVSLHQSLCWSDDDNLKEEFKNVDFLFLGELNTQEKQKLSVLLHKLGIPSLSEVVTREAIYYGPTDGSYKTSLVSWALPYAQRYIYSIHPNEYYSEFKNLKIVVVEMLFYKNVIKKFGIQSNKRCECTCLLQDNILYATRESDTHSLFMELSRFLLPKIPELHLANFLHMITTMAESGSTEEQMEFFITNNQKLLKLPNEESEWAISMPALQDDINPPTNTKSGLSLDDLNPPPKFFRNNSSSPPVNWKTAPGFEYASKTKAFTNKTQTQTRREGVWKKETTRDADWIIGQNLDSTIPAVILEEDEASKHHSNSGICTNFSVGSNVQPDVGFSRYDVPNPNPKSGLSLDDLNPPPIFFGNTSNWPPVNWKTAPGFEYTSKTKAFTNKSHTQTRREGLIKTDADWIMEENLDSTIPAVILEEDKALKHQSDSGICTNSSVAFNVQPNVGFSRYDGSNPNASSMERDQLNWGGSTVTPQQVITGRTGEYMAYKYFSEKLVEKCVKWVNEVKESGLPFDIIVEGKDNSKEYIEVKATSNARKDWFVTTVREWQFAVEQGDSFSIARVISHGNFVKITTYKNPLKLCQLGHLQLAIISPN